MLFAVITGGATYMVISRPDGAIMSEIVQNSTNEATSGSKG